MRSITKSAQHQISQVKDWQVLKGSSRGSASSYALHQIMRSINSSVASLMRSIKKVRSTRFSVRIPSAFPTNPKFKINNSSLFSSKLLPSSFFLLPTTLLLFFSLTLFAEDIKKPKTLSSEVINSTGIFGDNKPKVFTANDKTSEQSTSDGNYVSDMQISPDNAYLYAVTQGKVLVYSFLDTSGNTQSTPRLIHNDVALSMNWFF